ncbi:MAG TPA: hypothetical protein VHC44_15175, partial [Verrucomicrobiae bacterium]|nr:hypothetical protein [Verrucomicrobiae bacterium]
MKSKLKISTILAVFLASSILASLAQFPGAAAGPSINPATGLPVGGMPPTFDPTTGQPIAPADSEWKDANWKDPDITLTNVAFDGLPLSEVANFLKDHFKEQFDVLLPDSAGGIAYINNQTVPIGWQHDWRSEPVNLQMKNVTASEIFAAMNLLFENNRTPLRWELKI